MNTTPRGLNGRKGSTLVVVLCMTMLGMMTTASVMYYAGTRVRQAHKQVDLEQAFYVASGGAERAASRVASGNDTSVTLTNVLGNGSYVVVIDCQNAGGEVLVNITSSGTVKGVKRTVVLRGVRRVSWARYALWYDSANPAGLQIAPGERFDGRVYSKPRLLFASDDLATKGQVYFADKAWTGASDFWRESPSVNPIFAQGLTYNAPVESMASVNFSDLLTQAASGLVLNGATTITIDNQTMWVTNTRKGWNSPTSTPIPANGLVYVKTVTSGTSSSQTGDITLSAPNGLIGRLTIVSDNDIKITSHVRYKSNPQTHTNSTDALGLIAKRHVQVQTSAPNNLEVYAHIMCQDGGFGVKNYDSGSLRGTLTVYGGIVNRERQGVGTLSGTGYRKNYIFDKRFSKNPPPKYPVVTDELEWLEWEG